MLRALVVVGAVVCLATQAPATIIEVDLDRNPTSAGIGVVDTSSGLFWIGPSFTENRTWVQAESDFSGFRHATLDEVCEFSRTNLAGYPLPGCPGLNEHVSDPELVAAVVNVTTLLGETNQSCGATIFCQTIGVFDDGTGTPGVDPVGNWGVTRRDSGGTPVEGDVRVLLDDQLSGSAGSIHGHMLVRSYAECDDRSDNDGDGTIDAGGGLGSEAQDPQCIGQPLRDRESGGSLHPGDAVVATFQGGEGRVVRVDPSTGDQSVILDDFSQGWGALAVDLEGRLLASRPAASDVVVLDPVGGTETVLASGGSLVAPGALAVEESGRILVADPGAGELVGVNPMTGTQTVVVPAGFTGGPVGVALDADGTAIVAEGADLVRVNTTTGSKTSVCAGVLSSPTALAMRGSGQIVVIDDNAVVEWNPVGCTSTVLLSDLGLFAVVDLDVEATGDVLVAIAAGGTGTLVRLPAGVTVPDNPFSTATALLVLPSASMVIEPTEDPTDVPMLGGTATPGGLEVTCDATQGGALTAEYDTRTPSEDIDCVVTGTCPPLDFKVPGGSENQYWHLDFGGVFQGLATLVFRYDEGLLGALPELRAAAYHFVKGAWKRLNVLARNTAANTITVEVPAADGFSPFALGVVPACQDGEDNDGDTLVDLADGGCTDGEDHSEVFDCSDGINNDADGLVDWPADPGCTGASDPLETQDGRVCDDGDDDDGDELPDYRSDPGCKDALAMREDPACDDGIDNDGDGKIDWDGGPAGGVADPQCTVAWRNKEKVNSPCGLGGEIVLVVPLLVALRRWRRRR